MHSCSDCELTFGSYRAKKDHYNFVHLGIKFPCTECSYVAKTRNHLIQHSRLHSRELPFKCAKCGKGFPYENSLNKHLDIHKNDTAKKFKCSLCPLKFMTRHLMLDHLNNHLEVRPFKCSTCAKSFKNKSSLKLHEETHKGRKVKCPHCFCEYSEKSLKSHIKHVHQTTRKCPNCKKVFTNLWKYKEHMRKFHPVQRPAKFTTDCVFCGKTVRNNQIMKVHMALHTHEKPVFCKICGHESISGGQRTAHVEKVHLRQALSCDLCDAQFYTESAWMQHVNLKHKETLRPCNLCDQAFSSYHLLEAHITKVHTGERAFKCEKCENSYSSQIELRRHFMATHLDGVTSDCTICGEKFSNWELLRDHLKVHKGKEKAYPCSLCKRKFKTSPARIRHMNGAHTECVFCGILCHNYAALKAHILRHIGEYPFICDVCGKGELEKCLFRRHMNFHADYDQRGATVPCKLCFKKFLTLDKMKMHMRRQHGKKI